MSQQPGEMIPRIVVRDHDDALFIIMAIRTHVIALLDDHRTEARYADATKQMELSLSSIETTRYATELMDALSVGIETVDAK